MTVSIEKAIRAKRESKYIEFKESFDPSSRQEWCELIKDLVAISNSGGGIIVIGVDNRGNPAGSDVSAALALDPADLANKIHRYTSVHFSEFTTDEAEKNAQKIAVIGIGASFIPLVFTQPGTYPIAGGKQKSAFSLGAVYFRHGAKSEPGTTDDLRLALNRQLERIRKEWLSGVRKVVQAVPGSAIHVLPPEVRASDSLDATPIRIVDDPNAPAYRQVDPNITHPLRQMDVIAEVKKHLPEDQVFNSHDAIAIRRVYDINNNPNFYYKPNFGVPQYTRGFVEWIIKKYKQNKRFFVEARNAYAEMR